MAKKTANQNQQILDPEANNDKFLGNLEMITNPANPEEAKRQIRSNIGVPSNVGPTDTPEEVKDRTLNSGPGGP